MKFSEIKARTEALRGVKHTEGVWEAHGPVIIANGKRIAQTIYSDRPDEDAQLFAAAPEAVADRAELARRLDIAIEALTTIGNASLSFKPVTDAALAKVQS